MIVSELAAPDLERRLRGRGVGIRSGALALRIGSDVPAVADGVRLLYADYPLVDEPGFCDYLVRVDRVSGPRRWLRPQVQFFFDHKPVFEPMPADHALPLVEWALNWAISQHSHQFLVLHAAAIERNGFAALLPAPPGSGKSTLCAALVHRGWRLLSDELALVSLQSGEVHALARPISLKNRSIQVIADFAPGSVFSAASHETTKGTVAHLKVPQEHLRRASETATPAWVVFPRYVEGAAALLQPRLKPETMIELGRQAFNYAIVVREGFQRLADLVESSECLDFSYGVLDEAIAVFDGLAAGRADASAVPTSEVGTPPAPGTRSTREIHQ